MTDTNQTTDTSTTGKYDLEAIAADLQTGMSPTKVAEKHGCSRGYVHGIRRRIAHGGKTPARNVARAESLRKKAAAFKTDFDLLKKWATRDTADEHVANLIATLEGVVEGLTTAADLYDAMPPEVVATPKRASARVELAAGMIVCVREKALGRWKGVASDTTHLKVTGTRDTHVLVEDTEGARLFIPRKDLEVRQDG